MKVKLIHHDNAILPVYSFNEKTKTVTIKIFGTLCKFQEREYEVVGDE